MKATLNQTRRTTAGFTLIELLAVLAVIAATIQLFLPAVQRQREAFNRQAAEQELKTLAGSLDAYYRKSGGFPASLSDKALNFTYDPAGKAGHRLMVQKMTPQAVQLVSEPIAGVTGSETGVLQAVAGPAGPVVSVKFVPAPGADEARKRMFAQLRLRAAETIASIGGLMPATFPQLMAYIEAPATNQQAFDQLRGLDGRVGLASMRDYLAKQPDTSVQRLGSAMWDQFAAGMQLGAFGETWMSVPGLDMLPAVQQDFHFFQWGMLTEVTDAVVDNPVLKQQLLGQVAAAAQAGARGDLAGRQKAMTTYRNILEAQQATFFSWGERQINFAGAEILGSLARVF
jgi:prepilin-type N-terminal cleavage/methylation domain-containing protein